MGVEDGPDCIRSAGLVDKLRSIGWKVEDKGNLRFEPLRNETPVEGLKNSRHVGKVNHLVADKVKQEASKKNAVLNLGGDHSLAIGTISGAAGVHTDLRVIWVDAHADINTPTTSPSGNIHGMPVAFLMGIFDTNVPGFEWVKRCLSPDRIVYIGLRDVDEGEQEILKELKIKTFTMTEVRQFGIERVMEMTLEHLVPNKDKPIHLSFDVDGIDPEDIPSTGTAVTGGLTHAEAKYLCDSVAKTGCLVSMDIVEVNPAIGSEEEVKRTAVASVDLAIHAFGQQS